MSKKSRYYTELFVSFAFFLGGMALCPKGYPVLGFSVMTASIWVMFLTLPEYFKD